MSIASGAILLTAGVIAAVAPADTMTGMIIALGLLGLGWNLGLISGTALIVDATHPSNRAKTQGTVDVLIALAGTMRVRSGGANPRHGRMILLLAAALSHSGNSFSS